MKQGESRKKLNESTKNTRGVVGEQHVVQEANKLTPNQKVKIINGNYIIENDETVADMQLGRRMYQPHTKRRWNLIKHTIGKVREN